MKLQFPGSSLSESYSPSSFCNEQGQVGKKNWGREKRAVVMDLIGSLTTVRKSKCTLILRKKKMCLNRSEQDIQERNEKDMQFDVVPLGTSREEK